MYTVVLHDTETEDIVGSVTQADGCSMDFDDFYAEIYKSWSLFNAPGAGLLEDELTIEDYVEWYNRNFELQIDWIVSEFIQLRESDLK